jgi:PTH1 family peptidyl-tRNA hydrolase
MFLVAGLGNPGDQYHLTRHNIGFLCLDSLAEKLHADWSATKWQADAAKAVCNGSQLLLLKPLTFMNLSGKAVAAAAVFYKIPPAKIIVVHDEIDLPLGRIKIVVNRGTGGHNGIRSIVSLLGSNEFIRIRAGIGRPDLPIPIERYVLMKISDPEMGAVKEMIDLVTESVRLVVTQGVDAAMNKINPCKNDKKLIC